MPSTRSSDPWRLHRRTSPDTCGLPRRYLNFAENSESALRLWTLWSGRKSFAWSCKKSSLAVIRFESDIQFQLRAPDPKETALRERQYALVPELASEVIFCVRGVMSPLLAN